VRIEDSPQWKDPNAVRVDVVYHENGTRTLSSVDDDGRIVVTGRDLGEAVTRYLAALVEVYPHLGGTRRDVMLLDKPCASG